MYNSMVSSAVAFSSHVLIPSSWDLDGAPCSEWLLLDEGGVVAIWVDLEQGKMWTTAWEKVR